MNLNLLNFVSPKSDERIFLQKPFNQLGFTISYFGKGILFSPMLDEYHDFEKYKVGYDCTKILNIITEIPLHHFSLLPAYNCKKIECPRCKGHGKSYFKNCNECDGDGNVTFENKYHDYEFECKSCNSDGGEYIAGGNHVCDLCYGNGKTYDRNDFVEIGESRFNPVFIDMITHPETVITLSIDEPEQGKYLVFRNGEQFGLIAPLYRYD